MLYTQSVTILMMVSYILIVALAVGYANGVKENSSECSTLWSYQPPGSIKCKCGQSLDGGTTVHVQNSPFDESLAVLIATKYPATLFRT